MIKGHELVILLELRELQPGHPAEGFDHEIAGAGELLFVFQEGAAGREGTE
jgi:hypothetical protein